MKLCGDCKVLKEDAEFHRKGTGLMSCCESCAAIRYAAWYVKNKSRACSYSRRYEKEHKEQKKRVKRRWISNNHSKWSMAQRRSTLKRKYNISLEQYQDMLEKQHGVCKICGQCDDTGRNLAVDHDHRTGQIRALLCGRCNQLVGHLEAAPGLSTKLLAFLGRHQI